MKKQVYVLLAMLFSLVLITGSFYFLKIQPLKNSISEAEDNADMYEQQVTSARQDKQKVLQRQKEQAAKEKAEQQAGAVSTDVLPLQPGIEDFFVNFNQEAAKLGVTVVSVSRASQGGSSATSAGGSSSASSPSTAGSADRSAAASSPGNSSSSTSAGGSSSSGVAVFSRVQQQLSAVLNSDSYTVNLSAQSENAVTQFVGYIEALQRLLVITNFSMTYTAPAPAGSSSSDDGISAAPPASASISAGVSYGQPVMGSASASSAPTAGRAAALPVSATLSLTLYTAK
ncbi:MAG: hypothetical protein ABF868_01355 [Sporolactobacillus sp.]